MGVASELGYQYSAPNGFQKLMQAFGSTKEGAWLFSKSLARSDRVITKVTKGRTSAPALLAGLPVMMVTTTGRTSGLARTTPLIAIPVGDTLALLGTNFGQVNTPSWVYNLEADPRVRVQYREVTKELVVRPATEEETSAIWAASASFYGGYEKYRQRVVGREIRLFVLDSIVE